MVNPNVTMCLNRVNDVGSWADRSSGLATLPTAGDLELDELQGPSNLSHSLILHCRAAGSPGGQGICASTKESPLQAPFAQKTWISNGKYRLQLLVCMDEFNFHQKQLQVVTVNSHPTLSLNLASNSLRLALKTRPALIAQLQLRRSCRTPYVHSISHPLIRPS